MLNRALQGRQGNVLDLYITNGFVAVLLRDLILVQAVFDVSLIVDDEHVFNSISLLAEQWLLSLIAHLIEIQTTRKTIHSEGDSSHDRSLLLNNELSVASN